MTGRLSNDEFLTSITSLLSAPHSAGHGSVFLTQKPLLSDPTELSSSPSGQILVRATNGLGKKHRVNKKLMLEKPVVKLSTVVEGAELEAFYVRYAEVCKKGMEGLRKRDKKKAKAKKKKAGKGV